jgi:hypothetical protein
MTTPIDRTAPPLHRRGRASPPQAMIERAARVAESRGPTWHIEIESGDGHIVRIFQGAAPAKVEPAAPPVRDYRL